MANNLITSNSIKLTDMTATTTNNNVSWTDSTSVELCWYPDRLRYPNNYYKDFYEYRYKPWTYPYKDEDREFIENIIKSGVEKQKKKVKVKKNMGTFSQVQYFLIDTDSRLNDEDKIVFKSEPIWTSKTDEDLWFEFSPNIQIKLREHNLKREKVTWEEKRGDKTFSHKGLKPVKYSYLHKEVVCSSKKIPLK